MLPRRAFRECRLLSENCWRIADLVGGVAQGDAVVPVGRDGRQPRRNVRRHENRLLVGLPEKRPVVGRGDDPRRKACREHAGFPVMASENPGRSFARRRDGSYAISEVGPASFLSFRRMRAECLPSSGRFDAPVRGFVDSPATTGVDSTARFPSRVSRPFDAPLRQFVGASACGAGTAKFPTERRSAAGGRPPVETGVRRSEFTAPPASLQKPSRAGVAPTTECASRRGTSQRSGARCRFLPGPGFPRCRGPKERLPASPRRSAP